MSETVAYTAPDGGTVDVAIARFTADNGQEVTVTPQDVQRLVCPRATVQELGLFMAYCQAHRLDPVGSKDAYLIKYGDGPASMVTGYQVFNRRARKFPDYRGIESGVVVLGNDQQVHHKPGSAVYEWERLIGGWARVHVEGWEAPVYAEVALSDYDTGRSQWKRMPGVMVEKVAKSVAWRTAYPEEFGGMYSSEEMGRAARPAQGAAEAPQAAPVEVEAEVVPDGPQEAPQAPQAQQTPERLVPLMNRVGALKALTGVSARAICDAVLQRHAATRLGELDDREIAQECEDMDREIERERERGEAA